MQFNLYLNTHIAHAQQGCFSMQNAVGAVGHHGNSPEKILQEPRTHTCRKLQAGGSNAGINAQFGSKRMGCGDLTSGVGSACARLIVLTVYVTHLAVADVDVIDVRVGLQCEDEANQVRSRQ